MLHGCGDAGLDWMALTSGNYGGVDVLLKAEDEGVLKVSTPLVSFDLPIASIGMEDAVYENSGELPRLIKLFRLPRENPVRTLGFTRRIPLRDAGDNAIYLRLTQEDGTRAWTSPVYIFC